MKTIIGVIEEGKWKGKIVLLSTQKIPNGYETAVFDGVQRNEGDRMILEIDWDKPMFRHYCPNWKQALKYHIMLLKRLMKGHVETGERSR